MIKQEFWTACFVCNDSANKLYPEKHWTVEQTKITVHSHKNILVSLRFVITPIRHF